MVPDLAESRWSSDRHHGLGKADPLLDPLPEPEQLGRTDRDRGDWWRSHVATMRSEKDLQIRSSVLSGRPTNSEGWVSETAKRLEIDLTPRPRPRPPSRTDIDFTP
jgi:hypothetical protein